MFKPGDRVMYKQGVEQYAKVEQVKGNLLYLKQHNRDTGAYEYFWYAAAKCTKE